MILIVLSLMPDLYHQITFFIAEEKKMTSEEAISRLCLDMAMLGILLL